MSTCQYQKVDFESSKSIMKNNKKYFVMIEKPIHHKDIAN